MSRAVLLYNRGDRGIHQFFIENGHPPADWIHRVYDALVDKEENPVVSTLEELSWCLPESAGERAAASCVYQLQREGFVRRIPRTERQAQLTLCTDELTQQASGVRGQVWQLICERINNETPGFTRMSGPKMAITMDQLNACLRGLEQRGLIRFKAADRSGGLELLRLGEPLSLDEKRIRERRARELEKLDKMVAYVNTTCRRRYVVEYFGEDAPWEQCGSCDRCRGQGGLHAKPRRLDPKELDVSAGTGLYSNGPTLRQEDGLPI